MITRTNAIGMLCILLTLIVSCCVFAQSYKIKWSSVSSGGGVMSGANFKISGSIGQSAAGFTQSTSFLHWIGFWVGEGATPTFALTGIVNLLDFTGDVTSIPVTIEPGNGIVPITLNLDAQDNFTALNVPNGIYDVRIKATHWLAKMTYGVVVSGNTFMGIVPLINGDVAENNEVDFSDINAVRAAYGSFPGDETWNERADVDGSGEVDFTDINIVRSRYGEIGE